MNTLETDFYYRQFEELNNNLSKLLTQLKTMNTTQLNMLFELEGIRDQLQIMVGEENTENGE